MYADFFHFTNLSGVQTISVIHLSQDILSRKLLFVYLWYVISLQTGAAIVPDSQYTSPDEHLQIEKLLK